MSIPQPQRYTDKEYIRLGKLYAVKEPEEASSYIRSFSVATETDLSRIRLFYSAFCLMHNAMPSDFRGNLFKQKKIDKRRLFIACIVRLYMPHLYESPIGNVRISHGINKALSDVLDQKRPNVSNMIRVVVVHYEAYPEFKAEVDEITSKLIPQ